MRRQRMGIRLPPAKRPKSRRTTRLALHDDEISALLDVARPIPPRDRDQFLRDVATELSMIPGPSSGYLQARSSPLTME